MSVSGSQARTHPCVVTVKPSAPLEIHQVPTPEPEGNEVKLVGQWTASSPLDMHQALGHVAVAPPQGLGDTIAGTVVSIGPDVKNFKVGDQVFGFVYQNAKQKAQQLYVVAPENMLALVPKGMDMSSVVTIPDNFVCAWHTLTSQFKFELPWPKPEGYVPTEQNEWILIWGGGGSVALYALQIMKWYGYNNLAVVAGAAHEKRLEQLGAKTVFNYRHTDIIKEINEFQDQLSGFKGFKYIFDCIGHHTGSVLPVSQIARSSSTMAAVLPTIMKDAAKGVLPEYSFDLPKSVPWAKGVNADGVKTFFYMANPFLAEKLQNEIMPAALKLGLVQPNEKFILDKETLLERAQTAIDMLRDKKISGQRLVWKVASDEEVGAILGN